MPTIINPYGSQNSVGNSLKTIGDSLFGPSALQGAFLREKMAGAQRENENLPLVADALARGDVEGAIRAGVMSGLKGDNVASYNRLGTATRAPTIDDPSITRAQLGAGQAYSSTVPGFQAGQQTEIDKTKLAVERAAKTQEAIADRTPVNIVDPSNPNGYRTVSAREAIASGASRVLPASEAEGMGKTRVLTGNAGNYTPEQLKAAGALPPAEKTLNWEYASPDGQIRKGRSVDGGKTDMTTGLPLPAEARVSAATSAGSTLGPMAPDNTQNRDMRSQLSASQELVSLIDQTEKLIAANPNSVGPIGQAQKYGQNAVAIARDVFTAMGKGNDAETGLANIRQEAVTKYGPGIAQLIPELYNPAVNELETLHALTVYKTAAALAGQEGRNLSDRDVKNAREMVGDPTSWLTSRSATQAHLGQVKKLAIGQIGRLTQQLQTQNVTAGASQPAQDATAAPAAGQPRIRIDIDGNIVQ